MHPNACFSCEKVNHTHSQKQLEGVAFAALISVAPRWIFIGHRCLCCSYSVNFRSGITLFVTGSHDVAQAGLKCSPSALVFFPSAGVTGVSPPHQSWKYKVLNHLQGAPKMPEMPETRCGRRTGSSRDGEGGNGFNAHLFLTAQLHRTICMTISCVLKTTCDIIVNCSWQKRKVWRELPRWFVLEVGLGTPIWISQDSNHYGNKASRKAACKAGGERGLAKMRETDTDTEREGRRKDGAWGVVEQEELGRSSEPHLWHTMPEII